MAKSVLPHQLVVVQIIFGEPLRERQEFRVSDVAVLANDDFDRGNTNRVVDRLVTRGWVRATIREGESRGGRPPIYLYERTKRGYVEYNKLVAQLAKYGIHLK